MVKIGDKYGRLTVVAREGSKKRKGYSRAMWLCLCECGGEKVVSSRDLTTGRVRSCGCMLTEAIKRKRLPIKYNGNQELIDAHISLRNIWLGIIARCYNKNNQEYHRYGGRGIVVCEDWRNSSEPFIAWGLANGYKRGLSIDRINNDGNYSPGNCTFITRGENAKKKCSSKYLTANGKTMTLCEWSRYLNRNIGYLGYWMRKGGIEKAEEILLRDLKAI